MSTTNYITYPIETDPTVLSTAAIQMLMSLQPGFVPNESNLEVAMIEVLASMNAETRTVASAVPAEIFRSAGKSLFNLPAIDGAAASALSTWTMRDTAGYVIPAGTLVAYQPTGSSQLYFNVQRDVVVAPGSATTGTGEVVLVANQYGTAYNGQAPQVIALVDALSFVNTVTTTTTTSGGVDPETDDAYLNRLRTELHLLSPRPILASDFAVLALNVAGVGRAIAIDNYNPADQSFGNERMVAVAVVDASGQPVSSDIKATLLNYLESQREANFVVNVIDPTYTTLDVTATLKVADGFDPATVQAAAVDAVTSYLAPGNWAWSTIVRTNELIALLAEVAGVAYVDTLSQPANNVTLPGVAALVSARTVTISTL